MMLMPAIAQLEDSTKIVLVGRSPGLDFLKPYVRHAIDFEGSGWHQLFLEKHDAVHALSVTKVDIIVAFLSDPDGSVTKNLKSYLPTTSVHLFPAFPPKEAKVHVAFYLTQCLQLAGLPIDPRKSLEEAYGRPLLERKDPAMQHEKMVFHPGSGGKGKNHPPDFWIELIKESRKSLFLGSNHFILLLGPAEERLHPFFTKNLLYEEAEIVYSPEGEKLLSLLRQAPLYIGHDSGITHLAAMLGTPTIALFRNSPVHQWSPLGPTVKVIESDKSRPDLIRNILKEARELTGRIRNSS
jgi:heptosyltransferase-3